MALLSLCVTACGRLGFDARRDASGGDASGNDSSDSKILDTTICDDGLAGVLDCESFEGDLSAYGVQFTAPSSVAADNQQVYRGALALHSRATRLSDPAWMIRHTLPSIVSGELWARVYVYVPAVPAMIDVDALELIEQISPYDGVMFSIEQAQVKVETLAVSAVAPIAIARDRWVCLQEHIVVSNTAGSVETWVDGVSGPALSNVDTLPATPITDVHTAIWNWSTGSTPQDLWTDELIIGTAPLPCD
jgi:hypothetical protein